MTAVSRMTNVDGAISNVSGYAGSNLMLTLRLARESDARTVASPLFLGARMRTMATPVLSDCTATLLVPLSRKSPRSVVNSIVAIPSESLSPDATVAVNVVVVSESAGRRVSRDWSDASDGTDTDGGLGFSMNLQDPMTRIRKIARIRVETRIMCGPQYTRMVKIVASTAAVIDLVGTSVDCTGLPTAKPGANCCCRPT